MQQACSAIQQLLEALRAAGQRAAPIKLTRLILYVLCLGPINSPLHSRLDWSGLRHLSCLDTLQVHLVALGKDGSLIDFLSSLPPSLIALSYYPMMDNLEWQRRLTDTCWLPQLRHLDTRELEAASSLVASDVCLGRYELSLVDSHSLYPYLH